MLIDGCILYPEQYNFLWKTSFLSLTSTIFGIYKGHWDLALCPGSVFLSSINYWYKPDYSWRRTLDITVVHMTFGYTLLKAYYSENAYLYYFVVMFGIYFYQLGVHYYKNEMFWHSTYCHSMLHIIANIANFVLYAGAVPPLSFFFTKFFGLALEQETIMLDECIDL